MRPLRAGCLALGLLGLACLAARGEEPRKSAAPDPDPGFLEFLGSVDRLAEVSPDYLAQAQTAAARARLTAKNRVPPPVPPPAAPAPGAKNNE